MEIAVKIRFNASKEKFESFGNNRYLLYIPFPEDEDAMTVIVALLSRYIGVPERAIDFKTRNPITKDMHFYVN